VIGAGLMESGIAMVLLQAGFTVHLVDLYEESLKKGISFLEGAIQSSVAKGLLRKEVAKQMRAILVPSSKLEDLSRCSLVVEAVVENMNVKKNIFTKLDQITPEGCILLNKSTLDIDEMASAVKPSRRPFFAGWHFSLRPTL